MEHNVIRFADYERRSKQPDAAQPRDPCDAKVIVLPVIRGNPRDRFPWLTDGDTPHVPIGYF
jgi:hypothetical protein